MEAVAAENPNRVERQRLPSGVCVDWPDKIVLAARSEDAKAKRFRSISDRCVIYLVRPKGDYAGWPLPIYVDDRYVGDTGPNTNFFLNVLPGAHRIRAEPASKDINTRGGSVEFCCDRTEKVFIRQDTLGGLVIVGQSVGQAHVLRARKILDDR